jgi:hypothetical protein
VGVRLARRTCFTFHPPSLHVSLSPSPSPPPSLTQRRQSRPSALPHWSTIPPPPTPTLLRCRRPPPPPARLRSPRRRRAQVSPTRCRCCALPWSVCAPQFRLVMDCPVGLLTRAQPQGRPSNTQCGAASPSFPQRRSSSARRSAGAALATCAAPGLRVWSRTAAARSLPRA